MTDIIEQRAQAWEKKINDKLTELRVYDLRAIPHEVDEMLKHMADHGYEFIEIGQFGMPTQIKVTLYNPPRPDGF